MRVSNQLTIPDDELQWRFTPSGGPGGQHANRSNTRAELTWSIVDSAVLTERQRKTLIDAFGSDIRLKVDDHRSQLRNRELAAERLAERVAAALAPTKTRRATKPSRGAVRRRLEHKKRTSQKKQSRGRVRDW